MDDEAAELEAIDDDVEDVDETDEGLVLIGLTPFEPKCFSLLNLGARFRFEFEDLPSARMGVEPSMMPLVEADERRRFVLSVCLANLSRFTDDSI